MLRDIADFVATNGQTIVRRDVSVRYRCSDLVGGALRSAIVGKDASLLGPLTAVAAILTMDKVFAVLSTLSARFNRLLEGQSALLLSRGSMVRSALARHHIPEEAFARELRMHGPRSTDAIDEARLEANGKVKIVPVSSEHQS